jgi:Flp pilus assembly protein TadG
MAVISPILITLLFGVIEFGWAFMVRQMVTNASREGARVAAIQTVVDDSAIRTAVRNSLASINGLTVADSSITITHWCFEAGGDPNFSETVQVSIPYSDISLLSGYFSWITFKPLSGMASMRKEGVNENSTAPGSGLCS